MSTPPTFVYPSVDDIGAILRARTQDDHDDEVGTFNDTTRPTATEVDKLIAQAGTVVYGVTGRLDDLTCALAGSIQEQACYWIALMTAMLIELSYFPEQVRSDRSAFQYYKDLWDAEVGGFKSLVDAVAECRGGEVVPDEGGAAVQNPSWSFEPDSIYLIGWQTRW